MAKRRHKAPARKRRLTVADGGEQCRECRVLYCRSMNECARQECLALVRDERYECPDREEGNPWKLMDAA